MTDLHDHTGFAPPPFHRDVDLAAHLAACAPDRTTRGTFFGHVEDLVRRSGKPDHRLHDNLSRRRWVAFKEYPLRDFIQLTYNAARIVYPALRTGEGVRRIGWICHDSLANTIAGRVVLQAFGIELESLVMAAPKAYRIGLPGADLTIRELGPSHYRMALRGAPNFADTYHVGVLEGGVRSLGHTPSILVRSCPRISDVDIDLTW